MKALLAMLENGDGRIRLNELSSLCKTAGNEVLTSFTQKGRPSRKFLFRHGKVKEVDAYLKENGGDMVIFENLLTSKQALALEGAWGVPVLDKYDLILNVFELHATSREAKLQIELARLRRKLPSLKTYLSRRVKDEHPGFGGSGDFIIHSSLRTIHRRITSIDKELKRFERRVDSQRERRKKIGKIISLAGYTNVGKTTLMKALTGARKKSKDELFTTLQTKTASYEYDGEKYLVNDTIGFIRELPLKLIHAFNATLKDITDSDLVLLIHDSSLEKGEFLKRKSICEETLLSLNPPTSRWIHVENKIDQGSRHLPDSVTLSAAKGFGIDDLLEGIARALQ